MVKYGVYQARADAQRAESLAATTSPFMIEVRFLGGLSVTQRAAFSAAADRWTTMIVGDLPTVVVDREAIDDVLILAQGSDIDGPGRILGQAGPTHLRPSSAGAASFLPAKGKMAFDTADLRKMESDGRLNDVITHEMGHVLGVGGLVWKYKNLVDGENADNPTFAGPGAMHEYQKLRDADGRRGVPLENTGGPGTAGAHWREVVFRNELMSGFIAGPGNPLSRLTVASLADLGYQVDLDAAEAYHLPDLFLPVLRPRLLAWVTAFGRHGAPAHDGWPSRLSTDKTSGMTGSIIPKSMGAACGTSSPASASASRPGGRWQRAVRRGAPVQPAPARRGIANLICSSPGRKGRLMSQAKTHVDPSQFTDIQQQVLLGCAAEILEAASRSPMATGGYDSGPASARSVLSGSMFAELAKNPNAAALGDQIKEVVKKSETPSLMDSIHGSGNITFGGGVPVGGWTAVSLFPNGAFNFSGHLHVSGAPSYASGLPG